MCVQVLVLNVIRNRDYIKYLFMVSVRIEFILSVRITVSSKFKREKRRNQAVLWWYF